MTLNHLYISLYRFIFGSVKILLWLVKDRGYASPHIFDLLDSKFPTPSFEKSFELQQNVVRDRIFKTLFWPTGNYGFPTGNYGFHDG